jgi:hypothetical protein
MLRFVHAQVRPRSASDLGAIQPLTPIGTGRQAEDARSYDRANDATCS